MKPIPKSALAAFALLLAKQESERQQLARDVCEELSMPQTSVFDLQAGTVTEPPAPQAAGSTVIPALRRQGRR
jgi:hypothetical protein